MSEETEKQDYMEKPENWPIPIHVCWQSDKN